MNNKGQTLFFGIIFALLIITTGFLAVNFLKDEVSTARDTNHLNCTSTNITDGTKVMCLGADLSVPYIMVIIMGTALSIIIVRLLL